MAKRTLSKGGKIAIISVAVLLVVLTLLYIGLDIFHCFSYASLYTEKQHIERVAKRVEKKFMTADSGYTDFTVYPLYDENDKLSYFLVEFEPYGFVYIQLHEKYSEVIRYITMYTYDTNYKDHPNKPWRRYRYFEYSAIKNENGEWEEPYPESGWKFDENIQYSNDYYKRYEVDDNGDFIYYNKSHFKVANIENERMYVIKFPWWYVAAVKRGDKWLNLVSMELFTLEDYNLLASNYEDFPCTDIDFYLKHKANL